MLRAFLLFFRPVNLLLTAWSIWLFRLCIFLPFLSHHHFRLNLSSNQFNELMLAVLMVTLSGYWINDWADLSTDRINRPQRFLVRGKLSKMSFYTLWFLPVAAGFLLSYGLADELAMWNWLWLYPVSILVFVLYAFYFKRSGLIGNVLVSMWIAALPWLIYLSEYRPLLSEQSMFIEVIFFYSTLMFSSNLAREWVKDIEDLRGDRESKMKTWPIRIGAQKVWLASGIVLMLCSGIALWFLFEHALSHTGLSIAIIILAAGGFFLSQRCLREGEKNAKKMSFMLKLYMLLGLLSLLLLPGWWVSIM